MASLYLEILAGVPAVTAEQLAAAVSAYRSGDERFFPKPGALKALARIQRVAVVLEGDVVARAQAWEYSADAVSGQTACPVCAHRWAEQLVAIRPTGEPVYRWECWHDHDLHERAGVPYVGRPRAPSARERLTAKLDAEQRVADDVAAGRATVLRTGAVRYLDPPAPSTTAAA